jgi:hypothetical protein
MLRLQQRQHQRQQACQRPGKPRATGLAVAAGSICCAVAGDSFGRRAAAARCRRLRCRGRRRHGVGLERHGCICVLHHLRAGDAGAAAERQLAPARHVAPQKGRARCLSILAQTRTRLVTARKYRQRWRALMLLALADVAGRPSKSMLDSRAPDLEAATSRADALLAAALSA